MTREELREKSELASSVELLKSIPGSSTDFADSAKLREEMETLQNTYRQLKVFPFAKNEMKECSESVRAPLTRAPPFPGRVQHAVAENHAATGTAKRFPG